MDLNRPYYYTQPTLDYLTYTALYRPLDLGLTGLPTYYDYKPYYYQDEVGNGLAENYITLGGRGAISI